MTRELSGRVLLVNNKALSTGIGVYGSELFNHLLQISPTKIRMLNVFENPRGDDEPSFARMVRHLSMFWRVPRENGRVALHFLSANLGPGVALHRPCIFTLWDLISFIPSLNRQRVILSRGRDFPLLMALKFNTSLVRYSNLVICPSHSTATDAMRFVKLSPSRIRVIYPGVNRDTFRPRPKLLVRKILQLPPDKKIILNISVDEPRKNLTTLLRAFKKVADRYSDVILVRIGRHTQHTERLIRRLSIENRILHVPSPEKTVLYYNAADVLAFPSLYEGVGFPLLESMASGCPIVASNIASVSEILGDVGLKGDPLDAEGFARMLSEFISSSDSTLVQEETRKGLDRSRIFDWKSCATKTYQAYQELLS